MDNFAYTASAIGIAIVVGAVGIVIFRRIRGKSVKKVLEDPNVKYALMLIDTEDISPDTKRFRFKLPSPEHILGLPVGQHVAISARIEGQPVVRYYTPITPDTVKGYVEFVIKIYRPNDRFPDGGKMSQFLARLKPGFAAVDFRGPVGKIVYLDKGTFQIAQEKNASPVKLQVKKLSLVCGGTGITPMYQLIQKILDSPDDDTKISLLYANNTEDDILLRDEIDKYSKTHSSQFKRWYTITTAPANWKYASGRVNLEMFQKQLFAAAADTAGLICGPPAFVAEACMPFFRQMQYMPDHIIEC